MSKGLVAYFSASGNTKKIAEMVAEEGGFDLHEIAPEKEYTKADLNWMDKKARSTVEMNDPSSRPATTGTVENFDGIEQIYKNDILIYELHCSGGIIE